MRNYLAAVVMMLAVAVSHADAQHKHGNFLTTRTAVIDSRTGVAVPAVTRLHPVIGSVQRTSHFSNPFTHKARYSAVMYNPLHGTFSKTRFRR